MILLTTNARLSRHLGLKEREKKMEIEFKKMTGDIGKIYHGKKKNKEPITNDNDRLLQ